MKNKFIVAVYNRLTGVNALLSSDLIAVQVPYVVPCHAHVLSLVKTEATLAAGGTLRVEVFVPRLQSEDERGGSELYTTEKHTHTHTHTHTSRTLPVMN